MKRSDLQVGVDYAYQRRHAVFRVRVLDTDGSVLTPGRRGGEVRVRGVVIQCAGLPGQEHVPIPGTTDQFLLPAVRLRFILRTWDEHKAMVERHQEAEAQAVLASRKQRARWEDLERRFDAATPEGLVVNVWKTREMASFDFDGFQRLVELLEASQSR